MSQVLIFTSWTDARAGVAANVLLLCGVVYGFASEGSSGYRAGGTVRFVPQDWHGRSMIASSPTLN